MIEQCFQILDRVGEKKERLLHRQGIRSWDKFISSDRVYGFSKHSKPYFDRKLQEAKRALHLQDSSYFLDKLPSTETWRLYPYFKSETVFLDIETDGVGEDADITVIGLFDGLYTKTMIAGINLDFPVLKEELKKYKLIVTFNGSSFDLPFIKRRYDILPDVPHVDLRHLCARIGLTGGLKEIEKRLGIKRSQIVERMYGGDALTLWRMYRGSGDEYYLNLLVEYNEEDVFNLKKIMEHCYGKVTFKNTTSSSR